MSRIASGLAALACSLLLVPAPSVASTGKQTTAAKHSAARHKHAAYNRRSRHWHGYGFLPGYRPPEVIEWQREQAYWESGPHYYGPAWPGYYHGRWNGGGFGPCYVQTPIGYMWTCGK